MLGAVESCERSGGADAPSACAGHAASPAATISAAALRIRENPRDRRFGGGEEALRRTPGGQVRLLEPPARDLLARPDDEVAQELGVLGGEVTAGGPDVVADEPRDHLGVALAHLVDGVHRRVAVQ